MMSKDFKEVRLLISTQKEVSYLDYKIIIGTTKHLSDCKEALANSELGEVYYSSEEVITAFLTEGITQQQIYVAVDESGNCLGYIWIVLKGAFYKFPYCRSLAVKEEYRGSGVGSALLKHYERIGFAASDRIFIMASDFNTGAKRLYETKGFIKVGLVPDLFENGVAENILVKYKPKA